MDSASATSRRSGSWSRVVLALVFPWAIAGALVFLSRRQPVSVEKALDLAHEHFFEAYRRQTENPTPENLKAARHAFDDLQVKANRLMAAYGAPVAQAALLFVEDADEITLTAMSERYVFHKDGRWGDPVALVKIAVALATDPKVYDPTQPVPADQRDTFRSLQAEYDYWRRDGLSHEKTVEEMTRNRKWGIRNRNRPSP